MSSSRTLPAAGPRTLPIWAKHLQSLFFPLVGTTFLLTGPHAWWLALLFFLPLLLAYRLDTRGPDEPRQPHGSTPAWPFDALVYALAAVQLLNIGLLANMYAQQRLLSMDVLMAFIVVGASSGFSIVTAHELIHRGKKWEQQLGRLLLCTVFYEHFYTEHLRGHHVRVGTPEDPATARFGESFLAFYRRTVPGQFRSAWNLERKRLGDPDMKLTDSRLLRSRVVQGLLVGGALPGSSSSLRGRSPWWLFYSRHSPPPGCSRW